LLREGDRVVIDAEHRELRTTADLASRRASWQPPKPKVTQGALAKYARLVGSASDGATTQLHTAIATPKHTHTETTEGVAA
jgi:dihydroxy-acid dehydratase